MNKIRITKYLKPYLLFAIVSPIFMACEVIVDLSLPSLMSRIINEGVLGENAGLATILPIGIRMLVLSAIGGFFGILCAWTASKASQGFGRDLRVDAFGKVMSLSLSQTDKFTTGSLVTRLTNDITVLQEMVQMTLRIFVRAPIFLIGGLYMCMRLHVNFGLVMLCSIPVMTVTVIFLLKKANPLFSKVQQRLDRVNSVVQENVTGARVVKAYTREDYEGERFDEANVAYMQTNYKVLKLMGLTMPFLTFIMNLTCIAIIYIGAGMVELSSINVGDIMAASQYVTRILMAIMMVSTMFQQLARGKACLERIKGVLSEEPKIKAGNSVSGIDSDYAVELRGVSFSYPGSSNEALKEINLKIKRGENLAIIGATGCGKSTFAAMIPRFYDASAGEVLVDGVNVKEWNTDKLRRRIGVVLQKSELFSGTVKENILWGDKTADDGAVKAAAKIAQAENFINSMHDSYDSMIAEKGASLSGGQKQRISIARAIVRRPEILIFDDSTSALDLGTESKLRRALKENLSGTTVIMIAQRIASVMDADRIAVMENGGICDCGTHEELISRCPTYIDIYNSQMKKEEQING